MAPVRALGAGPARRGLLALLVPAVVAAFLFGTGSALPSTERDAVVVPGAESLAVDTDLCPEEAAAIRHRAVYLVDLGKPLHAARRALPGELLDRLANGLGKGDELTVFAVSEYALAPRIPLGRLCKPYAAADVARKTKARVAAGDSECGKLPAQLPRTLRDTANAFCEQRQRLRERVDDLAAQRPAPNPNAHLVEAIDETVDALAAHAPAATLHVFSDMFQESDWYSHTQVDWQQWEFAHFAAQREHAIALSAPRATAATDVEVFYLPRPGSTERTEVRRRHQAFWTDYFAERALRPAFHDQAF